MSRKIEGGLYLVIDPAKGLEVLLPKVQQAIAGGVDILQIWNNWNEAQDKLELINKMCDLAHQHDIPVLINEEWPFLKSTTLDGVHFDHLPTAPDEIRKSVDREISLGLTCGNDMEKIRWAVEHKMDYISFCAMFPSASAGDCEIVSMESVRKARELTDMPIFLSGGITLGNINELKNTGMNGVAVISGVLSADDPKAAAEKYKQILTS